MKPLRCDRCSTLLSAYARLCMKCGHRVHFDTVVPEPSHPERAGAERWGHVSRGGASDH